VAYLSTGSIDITSNDEGLLQSLQQLVEKHEAFTYEPDMPSIHVDGNLLMICFICAWECGAAWEVFDNLLKDKSFPYHQALVDSSIIAYEAENCFNPLIILLKKSGDEFFTYTDPLEDLAIVDVWDAFKYLIPFLPDPGSSIDYGSLEDLALISKKVKKTKGRKTTHYDISFTRDCIGYKFSFYTGFRGYVTGTSWWCDESTDDDEDCGILNATEFITELVYKYIRNTR
jgi:hypothetical protein